MAANFRLTLSCGFLAALLTLGACVNQQKDVGSYRNIVDAGLPRPKSYQLGETLSLSRALALANEDNEQIGLNGENYLQALLAKNRALAAFIPTVTLSPDYTIEQAPRNGTTSAGPVTPAAESVAASSGGYVVRGSTWQRTEVPVVGAMNLSVASYPTVLSADQIIEQQKQLLLDAQATILLNVAQAYYQVLRSEAQVEVLEQSLQVQQARLQDAQNRFNNKLALALEVSQTRAQVASTQVDLTQAENDVRNGRRTLAFLIGVPAVDGPLVDDVIIPGQLPPVDEFRQLAAAHRQDLLAADAALRAARDDVDTAFAQYYPSVSIDVSGFLYRQYYTDASKWDALLIGNLPLFSAGVIEADVRTAWSRLRQAALYQSYLRRQIDQDVQNGYDTLLTSQQEIMDLNTEVQAGADALRQSEELLKNGLAIPLDVLTAQQTLLDAQLNYTSASFDRTVFYLDLLRSTGDLNPRTPEHWLNATTQPASMPTTTPATMP
ncbi:MAG: TolC family protein [Tepidisphaeraceae bacterium]|jgi:outer membrane protein TolC